METEQGKQPIKSMLSSKIPQETTGAQSYQETRGTSVAIPQCYPTSEVRLGIYPPIVWLRIVLTEAEFAPIALKNNNNFFLKKGKLLDQELPTFAGRSWAEVYRQGMYLLMLLPTS